MKVSKAWLQTYFKEPLPDTEELVRRITFGIFEVESVEKKDDDDVLDIKVLPDRSSYCLSHRGIAREVAALLGRELLKDPLREPLSRMPTLPTLRVSIEDVALCSRYSVALIEGVSVGPSPAWLKTYLETLGQRSINNIVDATNFVMLNLGEPLHAFDAGKLEKEEGSNAYHIHVRNAKAGEKITTLTGETYDLDFAHLLITDAVKDTPIGIAGIKGGKVAEITNETKDIIIEAAHFNYVSIRKTSRALKLVTDASVRFQNEPSSALVPFALRDVVALILEIAGGTLVGATESGSAPAPHMPVSVSSVEIHNLLGSNISVDELETIFKRLGFAFVREGETFSITPPFERTDLTIAEDIIEEVGRVYGYEHIPGKLPPTPSQAPLVNKQIYWSEKIRATLTELGFSEIYTYTLCERGEVELLNPLASDKAYMRRTLTDGMLKALTQNAYNAPLLGLPLVKIFELGTVFTKESEELSLCLGARNTSGKASKMDEAVRDAIVRLGSALGTPLEAEVKNGIAEIFIGRIIDTLAVPEAYDPIPARTQKTFAPFSSFPFMLRDIAIWMPEQTDVRELEQTIREKASDLLVRLDLFDTFTKDGRTSYAFHLVFQSCERTLNDVEINMIMERITGALKKNGGEVR